jgi:transposase
MAVKGGEDAGHRSIARWKTTKIHVLTDVLGRPAVIRLTPGNVSDIRIADELIEAAGPVRRVIADRGYDANRLRCSLRSVGTAPIIPGRRSRKRPIQHDRRRYRDRWRIEAAFCRLKDFRRVATRYDKLAINFLSAVVLAAIIAFWV